MMREMRELTDTDEVKEPLPSRTRGVGLPPHGLQMSPGSCLDDFRKSALRKRRVTRRDIAAVSTILILLSIPGRDKLPRPFQYRQLNASRPLFLRPLFTIPQMQSHIISSGRPDFRRASVMSWLNPETLLSFLSTAIPVLIFASPASGPQCPSETGGRFFSHC